MIRPRVQTMIEASAGMAAGAAGVVLTQALDQIEAETTCRAVLGIVNLARSSVEPPAGSDQHHTGAGQGSAMPQGRKHLTAR
jgi:hypothetical protein